MNANDRLSGFLASQTDRKTARHFFEECDGSLRQWKDLSAEAKLSYIASDAARYDVPFEAFAEAVRDAVGDAADASLRLVLHSEKELHRLAKLLPDDGRLESTPLVERFKDILNCRTDHAAEAPEMEMDQGIER